MIARAMPWGSTWKGREFYLLDPLAQDFVLAHEQGHVVLRHFRERLKWALNLQFFTDEEGYWAMCRRQELEADRYAIDQGHLAGMVSFMVRRSLDTSDKEHPSGLERIKAAYHV